MPTPRKCWRTARPPYEHAFIQKPPMIIYSYALAHFLLPHIFWAPRLLAYLFVALGNGFAGIHRAD